MPLAHEQHLDAEQVIKRNPHPDFKKVEASRPPFPAPPPDGFHYTQVPDPNWTLGSGANHLLNQDAVENHPHREIDPDDPSRPASLNYKLLISGIVPRPIGFLSTRSSNDPADDDTATTNLAPFSYTQLINHDPPLFVVGFASPSSPPSRAKDTLRNLLATREASLNLVSDSMLEAANATAIDAPHGVSEWALSGLTPAPCSTVRCSRVKESVFSVECTLVETREWESAREPGKVTGTMAVLRGTRFWVREDALKDKEMGAQASLIDPGVLRPVARLGGITYAVIREGVECPRPGWEEEKRKDGERVEGLARGKVEGQ